MFKTQTFFTDVVFNVSPEASFCIFTISFSQLCHSLSCCPKPVWRLLWNTKDKLWGLFYDIIWQFRAWQLSRKVIWVFIMNYPFHNKKLLLTVLGAVSFLIKWCNRWQLLRSSPFKVMFFICLLSNACRMPHSWFSLEVSPLHVQSNYEHHAWHCEH